jgi:tetratricopeptide (TPR) repeat protein
MSRAWLPMRISAWIPPALIALVAYGVASASAQMGGSQASAVTVIGNDRNGRACITNVAAGDSSDATLDACTRALGYPRLTRAGERQLLVDRGIVYLRRRNGELALADFDAVIAREPRNAEAHLNRGAALVQLNRHGLAIAAITEALGLGVQEPHKAYYNRGAAREALGDLRGAYEDYSTALEIQPDWGPANAELARFARTRRDHLATVLADQPTP